MLAADTIAINRLLISADRLSSRALAHDMEQGSWQLQQPLHQAWVLVRQLKVSGKLRNLRLQTVRQLDAEILGARAARRGGLENANAVRFESFPELLAFLLEDLAMGQAAKWCWQYWAHLLRYSRQEAILRLLCEHPQQLANVVDQLHQHGQLGLVWAQLDHTGALTLVSELGRVSNLPAPVLWQSSLSEPHTISTLKHEISKQTRLWYYWKSPLSGLAAEDGRVILAAALYGVKYAPLWLQHQPAALMRAFAQCVEVVPGSADTLPNQLLPSPESQPRLSGMGEHAASDITVVNSQTLNHQHSGSVSKFASFRSKQAQQTLEASIVENSLNVSEGEQVSTDLTKTTGDSRTPVIKSAESRLAFTVSEFQDAAQHMETNSWSVSAYEFITCCGGLFYLINPLQRLLTPARLAGQTNAHGWRWLYDLYRLFAARFPILAPQPDLPLQRFLMQQLAPAATTTELQNLTAEIVSTNPEEFVQQLFEELEQQFGATPFWQSLQHTTGFFAIPARVVASASHLDIYFPLNSVSLDLRLAAWDINPGWVAWLGRVVTLHYVEQATLAGEGVET